MQSWFPGAGIQGERWRWGITYLHQRPGNPLWQTEIFSKRSDDTCCGWKSQRACVALWWWTKRSAGNSQNPGWSRRWDSAESWNYVQKRFFSAGWFPHNGYGRRWNGRATSGEQSRLLFLWIWSQICGMSAGFLQIMWKNTSASKIYVRKLVEQISQIHRDRVQRTGRAFWERRSAVFCCSCRYGLASGRGCTSCIWKRMDRIYLE